MAARFAIAMLFMGIFAGSAPLAAWAAEPGAGPAAGAPPLIAHYPFDEGSGAVAADASGGGTEILAGHGSIHGPGGQSVIADHDGDVLVYHYYADDGTALLGINRITWDSAGWPVVV